MGSYKNQIQPFTSAKKRGGLRKPSYIGPMVLLDFIAPEKAMAFRRLSLERQAAFSELIKKYPWPSRDWGAQEDGSWKKQPVDFNQEKPRTSCSRVESRIPKSLCETLL